MVFLELRRDFRITTGNSGFLLCWPRKSNLPFELQVRAGDCSCPERPAPAAAMAAPPPPDEQDFIQAYEEVREKYKGTAAVPAHPAGCLPADWPALTGPPAGQYGL